jgi:hypothetical protein
VDDARSQIGNGISSEHESDEECTGRPRHTVDSFDDHSPRQCPGESQKRANRDELEDAVAGGVVVGAEHPPIITTT